MLNFQKIDDISVVETPARLGIGFKDEEYAEFKKIMSEISGKFVINLENTKAIDSSTIGVILKKFVEYKDKGIQSRIAICNMKNVVKRSLEIIPIDKYISVFDDVESAVNYLKGVQ
ncbi:MAG TPA: STAS domain-containing protein [bacterium]|nr:STAS domain-containing protein [bacterium]HPN32588.1 STAS domain-containing protein [bacterium]